MSRAWPPGAEVPGWPPTFWLALTSKNVNADAALLEQTALIYLKNDLARVPGVADVRIVGIGELGVRVRVNPERLQVHKLMASDVVEALRKQNTPIAANGTVGGRGEGLVRTVLASGRLTKPEQFRDVILKANANGEVLRVRDVAEVELVARDGGLKPGEMARVNGKPTALLAVTAWPGRVTADQLLKVRELVDLPPDMRLDVAVDRTRDRLLEIELRLPEATTIERTEMILERALKAIDELPGKPGTVAFPQGRTTNAVTIFVKLPAKGGPTAAEVKKTLAVVPDALIRAASMQPGGEAFPIRLALSESAWDKGEELLPKVADDIIERLTKEPKITDPVAYPGPLMPHYATTIDRDKCAMRNVELDHVLTTLQTHLGGMNATSFSMYGRTFQVTVQTDPKYARRLEDLAFLFVRSSAGEMIPLENLIKIKKARAPAALVRVNGLRAVMITAAPASGQRPAEAAAHCVKLAQGWLPRGYRAKDFNDLSW